MSSLRPLRLLSDLCGAKIDA